MHCVVAVARSLVLGGSYFPEGPSHVLPLLSSCLPGIDPNDIKKCIVSGTAPLAARTATSFGRRSVRG